MQISLFKYIKYNNYKCKLFSYIFMLLIYSQIYIDMFISNIDRYTYVCIYIYIYIHVCMCVSVLGYKPFIVS